MFTWPSPRHIINVIFDSTNAMRIIPVLYIKADKKPSCLIDKNFNIGPIKNPEIQKSLNKYNYLIYSTRLERF